MPFSLSRFVAKNTGAGGSRGVVLLIVSNLYLWRHPMKAHEWLRAGADKLDERGEEYDQPEGERSMPAVMIAFNAITGEKLDARHGWLLMHLLKKKRLWTNPKVFHRDSAVDSSPYDALEHEEWDNKFARELLETGQLSDAPKLEPSARHDSAGARSDEEDDTDDVRLG
jgi:hypothetical protein